MSEKGNQLQTERPSRAGVSDEGAQEFQVISNGNANIDGPQVNFQNEISDPDEYAKATNATAMREAQKTDFSLKTKDEKRSRGANPTPRDPGLSLPADPLVTLPDRSCMGDPTYELDRPQYYVFDRGSTWKQKVYELEKCLGDLLQLIRLCPLRDTEHSMSMKGHTTEQNMTTVEDGYNTADDGETHNENRREIKMQQHSKLINLPEAEHILQIWLVECDGLRTRALAKKLVSILSVQHVTECTFHRHCTLTSFLPRLLSFSRLSTDKHSSILQYTV